MLRISSPYFVAGVILENDIVRWPAPILKYMRGWSEASVREYAAKKRWTVDEYPPDREGL